MPLYMREVAVRIFAKELNASEVIYKSGEDRYAPQYLLTPTGARANRVLITGVLTETENIGTESEYRRARIADPTGVFILYAGQYRPEALRFLAEAETPCFVTVIGKVNSFRADDGTLMVSVRPEYICRTDAGTRDAWIAETAERTYERLRSLEEDPDPEVLRNYSVDLHEYRQMLLDALSD